MIAEYPLFSIPIYTVSKKKFEQKYDKDRKKFETEPQNGVWLYNQVIGYIRILLGRQDILFEVYMPSQRKRYQLFSNRKSYCGNRQVNGLHFYLGNKSNEQIIHEIREWIVYISNREYLQRRYVDISAFDNIAKYIDIRAIVKDLLKEERTRRT